MEYPRFIIPGFKPFDPLELAKQTEKIVCRNSKRKYTAIYCARVYGGIATGYTVGCVLRCFYCWVGWGRDFPEKYGKFYSPEEVVTKLEKAGRKYGIQKARISGGEPTLGKEHLLKVLDLIEENDWFKLFILETNGILFGNDADYVKDLKPFKKVHVRVSLKAGTEEGFQKRTGAIGKFYLLPFQAIENLLDYKISFHVAAMTDPRIMSTGEREILIKKLEEIDPEIVFNLEEERIDLYNTTLLRLEKAGVKLW
jgi:uncharacterized Fe-S cluster-containing radical SAM superfamily protein